MLLEGRELAGFIKQRHYQQVRALGFAPHLAIASLAPDASSNTYMRIKQKYGEDIGAQVSLQPLAELEQLNSSSAVHGIIIQLPLPKTEDTDETISRIDRLKDVDGLRPDSPYDPATPKGIMWLLGSHGIKVKGLTAVVVGQGRLVGEPMAQILEDSGAEVVPCDIQTEDLAEQILRADLVIMATGQKHLLKPQMVKKDAVIIDAGSPWPEVDPVLLDTPGLKITPNPGGVGPMTVAALFDNLLLAAQHRTRKSRS